MKFDKIFDKKLLKNKTVIFFMIVLLYEMSKILLSKINIEYREAPARLFYWIIIIGIVVTGYRLLYKANLKYFDGDIKKAFLNMIVCSVLMVGYLFLCLILFAYIMVLTLAIIVLAILITSRYEHTRPYTGSFVFLMFLGLLVGGSLFSKLFKQEKEEVYETNYIKVSEQGWMDPFPKGIYYPLNSLFRRKITADYKLDELLESRYGMKFTIQKADKGYVVIPEQYPQLRLKVYNYLNFSIDFSDSLARWYFEKTYNENDMKMEYMYCPGEMLVANEIFCPVIDINGDFELYAKEISELIRSANSDPFFRDHGGKIQCVVMSNDEIKNTITFTFGSPTEYGKGAYYEDPKNVLEKLNTDL